MVESDDTTIDAASSAITVSIDALPNELLAHIFAIGAASNPSVLHKEPLHFALFVSHISRRWKKVAITCPLLWSYLVYTTDPHSDRWVTDVLLPRSGTRPLEVTVRPPADVTVRQFDDEPPSIYPALKALLPHCARWRTLCVRPRDKVDLEVILNSIRDISVPLLQHAEILCRGLEGEEYDDITVRTSHAPAFLLGAPALTSVRLRTPCIKCGPSLANLTSFECDAALSMVTLTQPELESIVAASPALRVLRLRLKRFEASGGTINIPSLRDLSLNCRGCAYSMRLFAGIHAPTLESLELIYLQDCDIDILSVSCRAFPDYPRPQTLKLFAIISARTASSSYDTLFRLFPTITSLYINHSSPFVKPVLSRLPTLRFLTYNCMPEMQSSYTGHDCLVYVDCVQWISRHVQDCHGKPHAMQSVRIGHSARQNRREEDYERLQGLVDLVELADEDDSLRESWSCNDETLNEEWGDINYEGS